MSKKIFTVTELTSEIKTLLDTAFPHIWISGELSNTKLHSSGHLYFTLKDETAQLSCAMWRSAAQRLKFRPEDGMKVLVFGNISFYAAQGKTQLYVETLEPAGVGALQLAFEQLKKKLETEGLFSTERKRLIPKLPRRVGIITSETGAVIHDLIRNIHRRFPTMDILVAPAKVQGDGAALDIAQKIDAMNQQDAVDVLIVGRGGGSLEDLWAFNEEIVARAIFNSRIPIISAVGHESDFTIADFIADVRASTPTAAAELAVPLYDDLTYMLDQHRERLRTLLDYSLNYYRERLRYCGSHLRNPAAVLSLPQNRYQSLTNALRQALYLKLTLPRGQLTTLHEKLNALSPLSILNRGYAIVTKKGDPPPLTDPTLLKNGEWLDIRLAKGSINAEVKN